MLRKFIESMYSGTQLEELVKYSGGLVSSAKTGLSKAGKAIKKAGNMTGVSKAGRKAGRN